VDKVDRTAAAALAASVPRPNPAQRSARSPYQKLAADLRQAIEDGRYQVGSELPTTLELAAQHKVAAGTVSRAVGLLRSAWLVEVKRGQRAKVRGLPQATG
jgi:integrase